MTLQLGWFSTGRGQTSRKLLAAVTEEIASGRLDAQIAVVFCNRERGEDENTDGFLDQVEGYGLPLVALSSRDFRRERGEAVVRKGQALPDWRREYDREVLRLIEPYPFEIGFLAGYMLIFSEEFTARRNLLNLHPAAPGGPIGIWQDIIWELIETRAARAGVMLHLATPSLDEGPPVSYCTYPIQGPSLEPLWRGLERQSVAEVRKTQGENNPLFQEIRRLGVAREIPLVIETLKTFATDRLRIRHGSVVTSPGYEPPPYDLTNTVERLVAASPAGSRPAL